MDFNYFKAAAVAASILIACSNSFAQVKTFSNKQISQWVLEKFPTHYYKKAYKISTTKAPYSNKIILYKEIDEYGEADGLHVEMQKNLIYPHTIYYYKKGITVYSAYYFANSNKPYEIMNKNLLDQLDGPQLKRERNSGVITQTIKNFENGEDKAFGMKKIVDKLTFNDNKFLEGEFSWTKDFKENGRIIYFGNAKNGIIENLTVKSTFGDSYEHFQHFYVTNSDSIIVREVQGETLENIYKISHPIRLTNSRDISDKDQNCLYYEDIINMKFKGSDTTNYLEVVVRFMLTDE